jgi:hypothetical protein
MRETSVQESLNPVDSQASTPLYGSGRRRCCALVSQPVLSVLLIIEWTRYVFPISSCSSTSCIPERIVPFCACHVGKPHRQHSRRFRAAAGNTGVSRRSLGGCCITSSDL